MTKSVYYVENGRVYDAKTGKPLTKEELAQVAKEM